MIQTLALSFCASYLFIAIKAFQQLNVVKDQYLLVVPTSVAMAFAEVYVVANIAEIGWDILLVLVIGIGSGLGAVTSMVIHKRVTK